VFELIKEVGNRQTLNMDVDIVFVLDLQLPVSITTKVLSSNPVHGEVCDDDKIMIKTSTILKP
jgi:hypothetical protein